MKKHGADEISWGLSAIGVAGRTTVELDETLPPAPEGWEIQISMAGVCLCVTISSPGDISRILSFMRAGYGKTRVRRANANEYPNIPEGTPIFSMVDQIDLSPSGDCMVFLSKDGELPDRFVLSLSGPDHHLSFDLHDPQTSELIAALEDVARDLNA